MIKRIKNKLYWEGILKPTSNKGKTCIIMYHGIDLHENREYNGRFFGIKSFENQITYYKKHYNIISLADCFENRNLATDKLNVAITFDDGYQNNLKYALPILENNEVNATFFITGLNNNNQNIIWADLIDICSSKVNEPINFKGKVYKKGTNGKFSNLAADIKEMELSGTPLFEELKREFLSKSKVDLDQKELVDYWKLLSPDEISTIAKSKFVKVGSHGFYHNNLGIIDEEHAVKELENSKAYLENLTQYEIDSIGYPNGCYSIELRERAFEMGFKYQCAVDYKYDSDKNTSYLRNRLGLYPAITVHYINYQIQKFSS